MIWWLPGVILFIIECYVIKHTVIYEEESSYLSTPKFKSSSLEFKRWSFLLLLVGNLPVVWSFTLCFLILHYLQKCLDGYYKYGKQCYWRIQIKWFKRICNFLDKPL